MKELEKEEFVNGTLYLGDARELIKDIPDSSIDLILTDPPYGIQLDEYDDGKLLFEVEEELWRVAKVDTGLVFYYAARSLPSAFALQKFTYLWQIIYKFGQSYSRWFAGHRKYQPILVFGKGLPKVYRRGEEDIITGGELPLVTGKLHPLFKSTIATSILLTIFSQEESAVLDPFAGFGSIPLVCEVFNRKWIAYEIDERKYKLAAKFIRERQVTGIKLEGENPRSLQLKLALM